MYTKAGITINYNIGKTMKQLNKDEIKNVCGGKVLVMRLREFIDVNGKLVEINADKGTFVKFNEVNDKNTSVVKSDNPFKEGSNQVSYPGTTAPGR